jgi:hypothetical protein
LGALLTTHSRALARCGEDLSHYRQIWSATTSYSADFSDRVWQFSWSPTYHPTNYPDLQNPTDHLTACKYQLVDIIRVSGARPDFPSLASSGIVVSASYAHAVLLQYLGQPLPSRLFAAAGDYRTDWVNDPAGYDQGLYTPNLGTGGDNLRHPYSSSFRMGAAFFDQADMGFRMEPGTQTNFFLIYGGGNFAPHQWSEVARPSQKVFIQDTVARYFGRSCWNMDAGAKMPVLMADGSAAVRAMSEGNRGANPNQPTNPFGPVQGYAPSAIDPPGTNQFFPVGPLWTRMNLAGRDFGGPEVFP